MTIAIVLLSFAQIPNNLIIWAADGFVKNIMGFRERSPGFES